MLTVIVLLLLGAVVGPWIGRRAPVTRERLLCAACALLGAILSLSSSTTGEDMRLVHMAITVTMSGFLVHTLIGRFEHD